MTIRAISGVFFTIWWAGAGGLLLWRWILYVSGRSLRSWEILAAFSVAWWVLLRGPTLFALGLLAARWLGPVNSQLLPSTEGLRGYLLLAAAVPVPQFFSSALFCFLLVWQNRAASGLARRSWDDLLAEFFMYLQRFWWRSCWSLLFLVVAVGGNEIELRAIVTVVLFVLGVFGCRRLQFVLQKAVPGNPVPLEDGPLKSEILRLAAAAHIRLDSVLVRSLREKKEGVPPSDFERVLHTWKALRSIEAPRLILPLELIQRIEPWSLTAGFAADCIDLGVYPDDMRAAQSSPPPKQPLRHFAIAGALIVVLLYALSLQSLAAGSLIAAGMVGYLVRGVWRKRKWQATRGKVCELHKAYQIWKEADPSAHRRPRDFVAGLAQFRLWTDRPLAPENWLNSFESSPGWLQFLDEVLPGGREEGRVILRRIRVQQR